MKNDGFTMLELMVVVILIAILTTLALPKLTTAAQKANIRSTRLELSTMFTKARAAAIQRGCVDSLHINSTQAWVTACKVTGTGRDTVGPVDKLGNRFGITMSSSTTNYGFDPRGLLVGFAGGTIVITGTGGNAGFKDSVVVNNVGKVTH